jgi:hypothetical protein
MSHNSRNQGFSYYICLTIEASGSVLYGHGRTVYRKYLICRSSCAVMVRGRVGCDRTRLIGPTGCTNLLVSSSQTSHLFLSI